MLVTNYLHPLGWSTRIVSLSAVSDPFTKNPPFQPLGSPPTHLPGRSPTSWTTNKVCRINQSINQSIHQTKRVEAGFKSSWFIKFQARFISSWWFQPTWKILVKLDHFPNFWGETKKYLSCHHLVFWGGLEKITPRNLRFRRKNKGRNWNFPK